MSSMTYRDIPVVRSAGFVAAPGGWSWSKKDKDGNVWIVTESDDPNSSVLQFSMVGGPAVRMSREKFDQLFVRG